MDTLTVNLPHLPLLEAEQNQGCKLRRVCKKVASECVPSKLTLVQVVTQILSLLLIYGACWGLLGKDALPGSAVFALLLLVVLCYIGGRIATLLRLPPLIGMLIVGFLFRNLPFIHFYKDIPSEWSSFLRSAALVVILIRAGFGINPDDLKRLKFVCLRLALLPGLTEALAAALLTRLLFGFSWSLCFCLGFVLCAISPAVVIPSMLDLQKKGYGQQKGITTLVITAASLDDVCSITGFSVCVGIAFSQGNLAWTLAKGPLGVIIGLVYGVVIGALLWYCPHVTEKRRIYYRVILLTCAGLAVTFMGQSLSFAAAGAIGCLTVSFVAALKWRKEEDKNEHVADVENGLWVVLQVFLFGLIGAEVSLRDIEDDVGYGIAVILVAQLCRVIVIFLALFRAGLNFKEKIFVAFSWLPKATVQAAIGGIALDMAKHFQPSYICDAEKILTVAVLSILITAPVGAAAIALLGPILLQKREEETVDNAGLVVNQEIPVY